MVSAEIQSVACSIPHDGLAVLTWNSDDGRPAPTWAAVQREDETKSRPERGFVITAWALLSLGTVVVRATRLIPWWLFALALLLILAFHS